MARAHRSLRVTVLIAGLAAGAVLGIAAGRRRRSRRDALAERVRTEHGGALPRVVIVGGGTGGLFCALALRDAPVETVLIDRVNHHVYEGLLHEVAVGQLDEDDVTVPLRTELGSLPGTVVLMDEVVGIDTGAREVRLGERRDPVRYDFLVLATGLQPAYFGHDEWAAYARPLKTLADALEIRDDMLAGLESAEAAEEPFAHPELTTFVLIGGGSSGVELAGALSETLRGLPRDEFARYDPRRTRIVLVEALPRLLPELTAEAGEDARRKLESMGVEVRLGEPVTAVDAEGVVVGAERIPSRHVLWTAGMRPSPLGRLAGLATDEAGRVVVDRWLRVPGHHATYVIGDAARFEQDSRPLPALASVALDEARYVARAIARRLAGKAVSSYHFVDRGTATTVGRGYGIYETRGGRTRLTGLPGKLAWAFAHWLIVVPADDRLRMLPKWAASSLVPRLRTRVITGPGSREERLSLPAR